MYADSRQGIYRGTNEIMEYEFFTRAFARICAELSQLRDGVHALGDFTDLFFICASHKA
jgi:hypothetical protein